MLHPWLTWHWLTAGYAPRYPRAPLAVSPRVGTREQLHLGSSRPVESCCVGLLVEISARARAPFLAFFDKHSRGAASSSSKSSRVIRVSGCSSAHTPTPRNSAGHSGGARTEGAIHAGESAASVYPGGGRDSSGQPQENPGQGASGDSNGSGAAAAASTSAASRLVPMGPSALASCMVQSGCYPLSLTRVTATFYLWITLSIHQSLFFLDL